MDDNLITLVKRAADAVEPVVKAVTTAELGSETPCAAFDLRTLVAHLIGGLRGFADVAEGRPLRFDADPDLATEDPVTEFRAAANRVVTGFSRPGALDKAYDMPWGTTTGRQLLGFELIELLVHGWDIGAARREPTVFDDDLVEATLAGARMWVDDSARTPQLFGPEVEAPAGPTPLGQLVAFLGRQPGWLPTGVARK